MCNVLLFISLRILLAAAVCIAASDTGFGTEKSGHDGGMGILAGGRCWFNCPTWPAAREALDRIRYTGVLTLRDLNIFTNSTYRSDEEELATLRALNNGKDVNSDRTTRVFPRTFTVIEKCNDWPPPSVPGPGPRCVNCPGVIYIIIMFERILSP